MQGNKHVIRYLPLFYNDLQEAALYIKDVLKNETAAQKLVDDTEEAIFETRRDTSVIFSLSFV